jgi:hypothetical protein
MNKNKSYINCISIFNYNSIFSYKNIFSLILNRVNNVNEDLHEIFKKNTYENLNTDNKLNIDKKFNINEKDNLIISMNQYNLIKIFSYFRNIQYSKFVIIKRYIHSNYFLTNTQKDEVMSIINKSQRVYHILCRFIARYKKQKANVYDNDTDLLLQPLSNYKKDHIIELYENNILYKFKLNDLVALTNKRLSHSPDFFSEPQEILNPYTNIPFSNCNLYKIYFKMKKTCITMPTLFHLFFLSNFNITDFLDKNEVYIREFAIGDYIKTASYVQKKRKLSSMLYLYRDYMYVDKKNTNYEKFIEKIEYLFPYYIKSRFSLNSNIQFKCDRFIRNELEKINTLNIKINEKKTVRRQLFNNFNSVDIPIITRYAESPIFPINENPITDNENDSENTIEEGEENENNNINETSNNNETQIETTVEVMVNNLINDTIIEINQDIENSQNIINNEELEGVLQIVPIHNTISNIIENNSNILNEIMDTDSDEEMFDEDFDY